jgi:hypothetical protein
MKGNTSPFTTDALNTQTGFTPGQGFALFSGGFKKTRF